MNPIELLFTFQGRINRAKYWTAVLIYLVAVAFMFAAFFFIPVVGIKRLHDRDKSGWWIVLFYVVPALLGGAGSYLDDTMNTVLSIAGFGLSLWAFVELGCLRGTIGPNQYGPDPLAPTPASSVR